MLFNNVIDAIGNTPLIELKQIEKAYNLPYKLYGKLERSNPSGSVKDRAARQIILDALENGNIKKDTVVLEATSGNTGISLAMICSALNLKLIIAMPESASVERRQMMAAFGAELILTSAKEGMKGAVEKIDELAKNYPSTFIAHQFENESNVKAHYLTTGKEIIKDLEGNVDVFIYAFGTSGTLIGTGRRLKEYNEKIEVIGVEPLSSPLINEGEAGPHKIQGIGANFVPEIFDKSVVDKVIDVSDESAFKGAKELARKEGLFVGISSGAALAGALSLNKKVYANKNIVIILPDNGERYLSVKGLYE